MGKKVYYICSFPKSGRTWLRFIIAHYLNNIYDLKLELDLRNMFQILPNDSHDHERGLEAYQYGKAKKIPLIISSHDKYNKNKFKHKRIIYLMRSVFDVLVSYYFHLSRQWHIKTVRLQPPKIFCFGLLTMEEASNLKNLPVQKNISIGTVNLVWVFTCRVIFHTGR